MRDVSQPISAQESYPTHISELIGPVSRLCNGFVVPHEYAANGYLARCERFFRLNGQSADLSEIVSGSHHGHRHTHPLEMGIDIKSISAMISHPEPTSSLGKSTSEVHKSGCRLPMHILSLRILVRWVEVESEYPCLTPLEHRHFHHPL